MNEQKGRYSGIIAALVVVFSLIVLNYHLPPQWDVVTKHSDDPAQVRKGIAGLEAEIATRIAAIRSAEFRAGRKANESRAGIGEPGETIDEAVKEELMRKAPDWDATAVAAREVLTKYGAVN